MKIAKLILFAALMLLIAASACAQDGARHPMLAADEVTPIVTKDTYFNVLLCGIDYGVDDYLGSYGEEKVALEDCHSDAMMVVSVNMDSGGVNLISLPRDMVAYVPGVYGLYKLNGTVNCGETIEQGLERACAAVTRILGGVEVSHYCAVDMGTMIALADAIGGVEFEMDMEYVGSSGKRYAPGMQTLDGVGVVDYLRARSNATREGTDLGRTGRQRELMLAIFSKVKHNPLLLTRILGVMDDPDYRLMTNIDLSDILSLSMMAFKLDAGNIGSYVLSGIYGSALGWSFTLIDQNARLDVLRETFGIEAAPLPYSNRQFINWLEETGLRSARYIGATRQVLDALDGMEMTAEQAALVDSLRAQMDEQIALFSAAAETMQYRERSEMEASRTALRQSGEALIAAFGLDAKVINYEPAEKWYNDTRINEHQYYWQ